MHISLTTKRDICRADSGSRARDCSAPMYQPLQAPPCKYRPTASTAHPHSDRQRGLVPATARMQGPSLPLVHMVIDARMRPGQLYVLKRCGPDRKGQLAWQVLAPHTESWARKR